MQNILMYGNITRNSNAFACRVNDDGVQAPGDSVRVACGRHNWQVMYFTTTFSHSIML